MTTHVATRMVEVRTKVLKANDTVARELRKRFHDHGVYVVSLVSSPGTGKTLFLEETLARLLALEELDPERLSQVPVVHGAVATNQRPVAVRYRVAALVGDLATENDARRLARSGAPVKQIVTGTVCHLEAQMVCDALADWNLDELDLLFIENVGNLVCPATYDLGEDLRLVLFSVTEGEDKPRKYPTIFNTADIAIITKIELASIVEFDAVAAQMSVQAVRPGMKVLELSAKTGQGMDAWLDLLESKMDSRRVESPTETALPEVT